MKFAIYVARIGSNYPVYMGYLVHPSHTVSGSNVGLIKLMSMCDSDDGAYLNPELFKGYCSVKAAKIKHMIFFHMK